MKTVKRPIRTNRFNKAKTAKINEGLARGDNDAISEALKRAGI